MSGLRRLLAARIVSGLIANLAASMRTVSPSSTVWIVGLGGACFSGCGSTAGSTAAASATTSMVGVGSASSFNSSNGGVASTGAADGTGAGLTKRGWRAIDETAAMPTKAATPWRT
jgi:hypothetical protein